MSAGFAPDTSTLGGDLVTVRALKRAATLHLLGDTIQVPDEDWQQPSLLPGWTRAHVATHLSRNADGLRRALTSLIAGHPERMYDSETDKERDIERGSERSGLALQIDLDTSSGHLNETFDLVSALAPDTEVELRAGFRIPVRLLPLARLNEVVLHHVDLGIGFSARDIIPAVARPLLEWAVYRLGDRQDIPHLHIRSRSGFEGTVGGYGDPVLVEGTDQQLTGWLTGRSDGAELSGNDELVLPLWG